MFKDTKIFTITESLGRNETPVIKLLTLVRSFSVCSHKNPVQKTKISKTKGQKRARVLFARVDRELSRGFFKSFLNQLESQIIAPRPWSSIGAAAIDVFAFQCPE